MTHITIVGNLGADPEVRFTDGGRPVARLAVGETDRVRTPEGTWTDGDTHWHDVTVWGDLAEHCAETLTKGMRVIVAGELRQRSWDDKDRPGKKRYGWQVTARAVGPELTFAVALVQKAARAGRDAPPDDPWATASKSRPAAPAPASAASGQWAGAKGYGLDDRPPF